MIDFITYFYNVSASMKCPKCQQERMIWDKVCENCGLIFAKYETQQKRREEEELGLLKYDTTLAAITQNLGRAIMLLSIIWGALLLWKAWRDARV